MASGLKIIGPKKPPMNPIPPRMDEPSSAWTNQPSFGVGVVMAYVAMSARQIETGWEGTADGVEEATVSTKAQALPSDL